MLHINGQAQSTGLGTNSSTANVPPQPRVSPETRIRVLGSVRGSGFLAEPNEGEHLFLLAPFTDSTRGYM